MSRHEKEVKEDLKDRKARGGDFTIPQSTNIVPEDSWPPCMKNIVSQISPSRGPHRALAVLATYLYQMGWPEKEASNFWQSVAKDVDVEPRIFDVWYGQMCCPRCSKIKKFSSGYPEVGLGGLDYCKPDSKCGVWPGDYNLEQTDFGGTEGIEWARGYFIDISGKTKLGYREKNTNEQMAKWVSDGWVCIDYILESINSKGSIERSYVLFGKPHLKKKPFQITVKAAEISDARKLKSLLENEFGVDRVGDMGLDVIKSLSRKNQKYLKILTRPEWVEDQLIAPGLVPDRDFKFNFERKVAVDFTLPNGGQAEEGVKALQNITETWDAKNGIILITIFFAAPVVAKLWPGDRFSLFLIGRTGSQKTSAVMLMGSLYGIGYFIEANLVRWGDGSTNNAAEHLAAKTGPFPFVNDNYKNYTDKDPIYMQRMIHAILEGTEKDRMEKSSNNLREADEYYCIPVITGENYPGNDSATRARVIQLEWTDPINIDKLTEAQKHVNDLNALGRAWCQWLSSADGKEAMKDISEKFETKRVKYLKVAKYAVNSGSVPVLM